MGPPSSPRKSPSSGRRRKNSDSLCTFPAVNSLWSVWYCTLAVAFQLYIVTASIKRFGKYIALPWPLHDQPYLELNAYVGFLGASIVLMPFFIATALLRVGNYPNDGTKIIAKSSSTKKSADSVVYQNVRTTSKDGQWARAIWRHGGPTAAFLHVASAFCLLLPSVFIEAQLIKHGFLKKASLWSSELDFLISHRDRLVSLSFLSTINETELWAHELSQVHSPPGTSVHQPLAYLEDESVSVSAEFVNFGVSLVVYAVRYPSVFWDTSKAFSFLFSLQLLLNGLQQLLAFTGFGVLYKVQVYGAKNALLRYNPLMLDVTTTVLLFMVYNMTITATSCALYGYGLQKHREWVERKLQRHHITWGRERWRLWGYTPHVTAFVVLVIMASTGAPIAYDFTLVYCGSLDGAILAAVTSTVAHLFLWIVLWLFLTVKQRWKFQDSMRKKQGNHSNPVKSPFCNGHIPKGNLMTAERGETPLLVIDNGQTYQVRESSSRKAILNLAHRSMLRQKNSTSIDDEDVYWLKPRPPSPKDDPREDDEYMSWPRGQIRSPGSKHKVTFEEALLTSPTRRKSTSKSPKHSTYAKGRKPSVKFEDFTETASDDGDYATLTDLPNSEGCVDDHVHRSLCPLGGSEVTNVGRHDRIRSEVDDDLDYEDVIMMRGTVHPLVRIPDRSSPLSAYLLPPEVMTAGCGSTRSTDSGASGVADIPPHHKHHLHKTTDSASESSNSPEKGYGPGSDTSSGVHSGGGSSLGGGDKRASSLENVSLDVTSLTWRNASLQRSIDPTTYYESGVVICRRSKATEAAAILGKPDAEANQPYGRATNMRMTSFTEKPVMDQ